MGVDEIEKRHESLQDKAVALLRQERRELEALDEQRQRKRALIRRLEVAVGEREAEDRRNIETLDQRQWRGLVRKVLGDRQMSVAEIFDAMVELGVQPSKASLYKNLSQWVSAGEVVRRVEQGCYEVR